MSRNFYACQCLFKLGVNGIKSPGKTVYVFKTMAERDSFLDDKDPMEYYKVSQKEAFRMTDLTKSDSIPCVQRHSYFSMLSVLKNIRSCWGSSYQLLKEF